MKPRLLLIDESQQGMDAIAVRRLETLLREEKAAGVAGVFVCHDMEFIARNADKVLVFHDGHLLSDGSPLEIFSTSAVLGKTGLAAPESLQLSIQLGLPATLSAEQLATAWLCHLSVPYQT